MHPIVIIGTGLSGYNLTKEIRKVDSSTALFLVTADQGESYSKPMLSNMLAKGKTPNLLVNATAEQMAAQLNATIWTNSPVTDIDSQSRVIHAGGKELRYSALVLAVGASQVSAALQGNAAEQVCSINSLGDYHKIYQRLKSAQHVAIIGPGLIGCEFANDIAGSGKKVSVIGPGQTPLNRLLPTPAGQLMQNKLSEIGVHWHLGTTVQAVDRAKPGYDVTLANGETIHADLVLSALGLTPQLSLAAKIDAAVNRGIIVDRTMQTSIEHVYALGDCIEIESLFLPYVMPIMHGARALAKTLTGAPSQVSFPVMPVVVKTPAHFAVVSPPQQGSVGNWQVEADRDGARALYYSEDEKLLGFALTGNKVEEKQTLAKLVPAVLP